VGLIKKNVSLDMAKNKTIDLEFEEGETVYLVSDHQQLQDK